MNKDLRALKVSMPLTQQTAIIGNAFDPIAEEAAVLYFTGTFCGPCSRMSPVYVQLKTQFPNIPAIAVSHEDPARINHHYAKVKAYINYSISSVATDVWETLTNELDVDGMFFYPPFPPSLFVFSI